MPSKYLANLPAWDGVPRLSAWLEASAGFEAFAKDEILAAEVPAQPLGEPNTDVAVCFIRRPYQADIGLVFFDPARLPAP